MADTLKMVLPEELQRYVESRVADHDLFSSPDEFIRSLIRRDMQGWMLVQDIAQGLREARNAEFAEESILDILNEA